MRKPHRAFQAFILSLMSLCPLSPSWALPAACEAPSESTIQWVAGSESLAGESRYLAEQLLNYTDAIETPRGKYEEFRLQLEQLKSVLENQSPAIHRELLMVGIKNYFSALANLGAVQLALEGPARVFTEDQDLVLPTTEVIRAAPTTLDQMDGLFTGVTTGVKTRLFLKLDTKLEIHREATMRVRKSNLAKQYFEASKCMLTSFLVGKNYLQARLTQKWPNLDFGELTICSGLPVNDLQVNRSNFDWNQRMFDIQGLVQRSYDHMTTEERDKFRPLPEAMGVGSERMMFLSLGFFTNTDAGNPFGEFNQKLLLAEQKLLESSPHYQLQNQLAVGLQGVLTEHLNSCGHETQLENFLEVFNRISAGAFADTLSTSSALSFNPSEATLSESLQAAYKSTLSLFAYEAASASLLDAGVFSLENYSDVAAQLNRLIVSYIDSELQDSPVIEKLVSDLKAKKPETPDPLAPHLKEGEKLLVAAEELHKIMHPMTPKEDLKFSEIAIGKILNAIYARLRPDYGFHITQMLTRTTHEDRVKAWEAAKKFISNDRRAHQYECDPVSGLASFGQGVAHLAGFEVGTSMAAQGRIACVEIHRLAEHLGLDLDEAPKSMADIWPSFERYYSSSTIGRWLKPEFWEDLDLKAFERRYREVLKFEYLDEFRVLDISLDQLALEGDGRVYDYLVDENHSLEQKRFLLDRALKFTQANLEIEILQVANAEKIEDLHEDIRHTTVISNLFGSGAMALYEPGELSLQSDFRSLSKNAYPAIISYHEKYRSELMRKDALELALHEQLHGKITQLFFIGMGAWAIRGGLTLMGAGGKLHTLGSRVTGLWSGYSTIWTFMFAGSAIHSFNWVRSISRSQDQLARLHSLDGILLSSEPPFLNYNDYLDNKFADEVEKEGAQIDMVVNGAFTFIMLGTALIEPFMLARGAHKARTTLTAVSRAKAKEKSWAITLKFSRFQMRNAMRASSNDLKLLEHTGTMDVGSLRASLRRAIQNSPKERVKFEMAYRRIIDRIGQNAVGAQKSDRVKEIAEVLFKNRGATSKVRELRDEYHRLFPDPVLGGI